MGRREKFAGLKIQSAIARNEHFCRFYVHSRDDKDISKKMFASEEWAVSMQTQAIIAIDIADKFHSRDVKGKSGSNRFRFIIFITFTIPRVDSIVTM